ncbi:MAG TPA: thioredoxin domain-containing protein [Pyrinomonadaceae bacterium]|jgi:protein-disulfide isomerase|nr:thioredoxin domain-containing protein [Pyrinomonadaceae bacterium]
MKRILPFVIIAVVLGGGLLTARYLQGASTETPKLSPSPNASPNASAEASVVAPNEPGAEPSHALGDAKAPVTLEEFGDFECPPCGMLHPVLKGIETEYGPQKVRIVFREFPLVPNHVHALAAARAAEAAGLQGKFWEMHDLIYEHQKDWHEAFDVRPIFDGYAKSIGLDMKQFTEESASEIVERRIFLDGKRAHSLGVSGTPTVFLNGKEVPFQSLAPDKLKPLINAELAAHQ